ncbi:hypothetical protein BO94DRAFT_535231 [Aspergillus sclerotioniger CBS 115572]|uniref:N-acetyltransferase domain-containing protein n=1 Tax=Aspergillus sclerotioniger CBS 115572 TaxID=1450535 RepID=A0A317WSF6_9EURO|nr:hypothetical protein BO94DRAFT_535231 [Aspergillus sclerotioniger CBS 115572]PWY87130.1 hypothetical protein BO94DRAFT_535231 [Aspergillus sclerotioniger CBS 115572]
MATLTPINLHHPPEYTLLQHHRTICGWHSTDDVLLSWREKQDAGLKSFFWITIPNPEPNESSTPIHAGHISLDSYADPPDPDLARADRSILTIQTFFILPEYRAGGLGREAMTLVEALATKEPYGSPRCEYLTVNTTSKGYYVDGAGEKRRQMLRVKQEEEGGFPVVLWYERLGYVWWKTEERYKYVDGEKGEEVWIEADFLRKRVG